MSVTVQFNDNSTPGPSGPITDWDLDFGDGSAHATGPGPWPHTYTADDTYEAVLTVTGTGADGTATVTHSVPISSSSPTPPAGTAWEWDATAATVAAGSASKVASFLTYCGPLAYFFIEVAHAVVTSHAPADAYTVSSAGKPGAVDATIYVPNGTLGGLSNDQHLWIEDQVSGRWHDLDGVSFSGGKLVNWRFGSSMDADVVNVPRVTGKTHQGATAALFPLKRGTVTPDEVTNGVIPHALVFVAANLGPAPNPYPANSLTGYTSGNQPAGSSITGHIPLGTWMRMDPTATIPSSATLFEKMIFECLKTYGMFCRDRGSSLSLHGQDLTGGGNSISAWKHAGVALNSSGVLHLSNIPWNKLQVLEPPTP